MNNLYILGPMPLPIGGVTVHVKRLVEMCEKHKVPYKFVDIKKESLLYTVLQMSKSQFFHLHTSNSLFRVLLLLLSKICFSKSIVTFHGDLGRYSTYRNWLDYFSVFLANTPVLLNKNSITKAKKLNSKSKMCGAFIPPGEIEELQKNIKNKIDAFKNNSFHKLYATNAYNVSFDSKGKEIYCITELISVFSNLKDYGLIISDPSGNYLKYLKKLSISIPKNVLFISEEHDFINVINSVDGLIRATRTDGDSLTVKEALYFKIKVICSNCVDRPNGVLLYDTENFELLNDLIQANTRNENVEVKNGFLSLLKIYDTYLK